MDAAVRAAPTTGYDPRPVLARVTEPILWVNGAIDRQVSTTVNTEILGSFHRPNWAIEVLPGVDRGLFENPSGLEPDEAKATRRAGGLWDMIAARLVKNAGSLPLASYRRRPTELFTVPQRLTRRLHDATLPAEEPGHGTAPDTSDVSDETAADHAGVRVLEGARAIRPHLPELLGGDAEQVDRELAVLLERAPDDPTVHMQVTRLLRGNAATREWMRVFLEGGVSGDVERGYEALAGRRQSVRPIKYVCPKQDYVAYASSVGEPMPPCPTHRLALVLAT